MLRLVSMSAVLLVMVSACGARSGVGVGPVPDAGPRPDGAVTDGGMPDAGPTMRVDCGAPERFTTSLRSVTLEAVAMSPDEIVRDGWSTESTPMLSTVVNAPVVGPTTTLTPDRLGAWLLRYTAEDAAGRTASCDVRVEAIVGPPRAICPAEALRTPVGVALTLSGDAFDDVGVVSASWSQVEGPAPAMLTVTGGMGAVVEMQAAVAGTYVFELLVTDTDGATNACRVSVRVTAPPVVTCPTGPISAPTRRPVALSAMATDEGTIVSTEWSLEARPATSASVLSPTAGLSTSLTPDRQGRYGIRFTATDDDGERSSCTVDVIGTPTAPDIMCPEVVETPPLRSVSIMASGVDDGTIVSWAWRVVTVPPGSRPASPAPATAATTVFRPDLAGTYVLEVTGTDDDGQSGTCSTRVRAVSGDGLRVEVFWDSARTDMDTHVLNPTSPGWFDMANDCFYANCITGRGGLRWGAATTDDDPRLDIDDTDGFGPENINVLRPQAGTYRVGVHAFSGSGRVTVRIYCDESATEPRQTFGPITVSDRNVWTVADVTVGPAGCSIANLATGGRPRFLTNDAAQTMR